MLAAAVLLGACAEAPRTVAVAEPAIAANPALHAEGLPPVPQRLLAPIQRRTAVSVHLADRVAGAVSVVGISNFVSFLENTESYRRDLRRAEYGDERDPAMRAFLESISPLNLADRICKPLFVVQGRNDPRVPWTESEQIVRRLQARGTAVWYLLADNESHGFARRENADFYFAALATFIEQTLLH